METYEGHYYGKMVWDLTEEAMSELEQRIGKLETAAELEDRERWVDAYSRHGLSHGEAIADWLVYRAVLKQHPPVPAKRGKVDITPTVLALAEALGLDGDELLQEEEKVIREVREGRLVL